MGCDIESIARGNSLTQSHAERLIDRDGSGPREPHNPIRERILSIRRKRQLFADRFDMLGPFLNKRFRADVVTHIDAIKSDFLEG